MKLMHECMPPNFAMALPVQEPLGLLSLIELHRETMITSVAT